MRQNDTNEERTKVIEGFSTREKAAARQKNERNKADGFRPAAAKIAKASNKTRQSDFSPPRSVTEDFKKAKPSEKQSAPKKAVREKEAKKIRGHIPSPFTGLLLALIIVLAIASFITIVSQTTKIDKISIKTEDVGFNDKALKICEKLKGKSYIGLDSADIEKAILKLSPLISECNLSGQFPRKLEVSITYESPAYYTCSEDMFYALSPELKILGKGRLEELDITSVDSSLVRLYLPSFIEEEIGENIEFSSGESYIFRICEKLADYEALGKIHSVDLSNTQRISFIFEKRFRCDLGSSDDIEAKLTAAENIFKNKLQGLLGTERTAIINVSNPTSASVRTDVPLENGT